MEPQLNGRRRGRRHADVAIIGFGPVGAVLAGLLGRRGLDVLVVEAERDVFQLPRAAHVDHTGLRTIQELGCLDDLLPTMLPNPGLDFLTASGELLMRVPGNQSSVSSLPASMYFHQPVFDNCLRDVCARMPNVVVRLGTRARAFTQHDDHVEIAVGEGSDAEMLTASWVVGCDGAWSTVRESSGMTFDDLRFEERWLVVDLLLREPASTLPTRAVTICDPRRPLYSIPMPPPRHRFEFMLRDDEDDAFALRPGTVQSLIAPWLRPEGVDVERSAVYTFHGLVAHEWRRDRLLIAGDAAHQMPPFLGQGMCSGIRDAANLAWKLDHVVSKAAPDALLDTYGLEREPHVRSIVEAAVSFGRVICTVDPVAAAERDRRILADPTDPTERVPFNLPALRRGPLVGDGGGELFLQPAGTNGGPRFDDLVGPRFLVLARSRDMLGAAGEWWSERLGAYVASLAELPLHERPLRRWLDAREADVVVVRPDRYVLGAGRDLDALTHPVADLLVGDAGAAGALSNEAEEAR